MASYENLVASVTQLEAVVEQYVRRFGQVGIPPHGLIPLVEAGRPTTFVNRDRPATFEEMDRPGAYPFGTAPSTFGPATPAEGTREHPFVEGNVRSAGVMAGPGPGISVDGARRVAVADGVRHDGVRQDGSGQAAPAYGVGPNSVSPDGVRTDGVKQATAVDGGRPDGGRLDGVRPDGLRPSTVAGGVAPASKAEWDRLTAKAEQDNSVATAEANKPGVPKDQRDKLMAEAETRRLATLAERDKLVGLSETSVTDVPAGQRYVEDKNKQGYADGRGPAVLVGPPTARAGHLAASVPTPSLAPAFASEHALVPETYDFVHDQAERDRLTATADKDEASKLADANRPGLSAENKARMVAEAKRFRLDAQKEIDRKSGRPDHRLAMPGMPVPRPAEMDPIQKEADRINVQIEKMKLHLVAA